MATRSQEGIRFRLIGGVLEGQFRLLRARQCKRLVRVIEDEGLLRICPALFLNETVRDKELTEEADRR